MHYYIDGYNLLFHIADPSVDDLQTHRETLIKSLNAKIAELKLDVTIVFDSHSPPREGSRTHFKHLEILFTPTGITADEFILERLESCRRPQQEIVVTSDKDLALKARHCSAATISIEKFLYLLSKRPKDKQKSPGPPAINKPTKKSVVPPLQEIKPPQDGSIDYYLKEFEEKLKALTPPEQPAISKRLPKKKKKTASTIVEDAYLTEEERWLKIFQGRLKGLDPNSTLSS